MNPFNNVKIAPVREEVPNMALIDTSFDVPLVYDQTESPKPNYDYDKCTITAQIKSGVQLGKITPFMQSSEVFDIVSNLESKLNNQPKSNNNE